MTNILIIIVLVVLIAFGIKETIKHFKGEGACCGGTTRKPRRKKLKHKIIHKYIFDVEGMQCQNCANAITRTVNDIDGALAKVKLKSKTATVYCDRDVSIETLKNAVHARGYVLSLRSIQ